MSKTNKKIEQVPFHDLNTDAVFLRRSDSKLLAQGYKVTIINGVVVGMEQVSRAEDLPATIIGAISRLLWKFYRGEK